MVEAPRIRIIYQNLKFTNNRKILNASGASYQRIGIDLVGYTIKNWWFAGKYIYTYLIKENSPSYIIRTHTMMYGKIIVNDQPEVNPRLRQYLRLELDDGTTLTWYLTQIKILDPKCGSDILKSNYQSCSSREAIEDSFRMIQYDISHPKFNLDAMMEHLSIGTQKFSEDILVDFLLNQGYFPGVGNILQQEALYRCKLLPTKKVAEISQISLACLVSALKEIIGQLYQSYLDKRSGRPHTPILQIYHKAYCPLGHKTVTRILGDRKRRTTWCPICQQ